MASFGVLERPTLNEVASMDSLLDGAHKKHIYEACTYEALLHCKLFVKM